MKVALIHTEGDVDTTGRLMSVLEDLEIQVETFSAGSTEDKGRFPSFLNPYDSTDNKGEVKSRTTHALIFSQLPLRWFDFLAGFSYGAHMPFLVYGEKASIGVPEGFSTCFTMIETETELREYLEKEKLDFKQREDAIGISKARGALLETGIPINNESLAHCAGEGNIWEVSLFLAAGFSPDTKNKAGVPLLNVAARKGNKEVFRYLILAGASVNLVAEDRGTSPLIDSVMSKHPEITEDLVKAGADLNIASKDGQTALTVAVGAGDAEMVELLLKAGADPDITDSMGQSARKYAALFRKDSITTLFNTYAPQKPE